MLFAFPAFAQDLPPPTPPPLPAPEAPQPAYQQPAPAPAPAVPDYQPPPYGQVPISNPVMEQPEAAPPQQQQQMGYFDRCFAVPAQLWVQPVPRLGVVVSSGSSGPRPSSGGSSSSSSGGGNGGNVGSGGDGKAFLILAVVAAMVLPVVVYALDSDAPPIVVQRFHCPSFGFEGYGGGESSPSALPGAFATMGIGRVTMAYSYFATDFQFDISPFAVSALSTHFIVRVTPKKHVEGGLALGYHRAMFDGEVRDGFELGVPHRYAFWRDGLRTLGLELRPSLIFGGRGLDAALDAAFIIPLFEILHLRAGGRVFSFGRDIFWGFNAGLNLTL